MGNWSNDKCVHGLYHEYILQHNVSAPPVLAIYRSHERRSNALFRATRTHFKSRVRRICGYENFGWLIIEWSIWLSIRLISNDFLIWVLSVLIWCCLSNQQIIMMIWNLLLNNFSLIWTFLRRKDRDLHDKLNFAIVFMNEDSSYWLQGVLGECIHKNQLKLILYDYVKLFSIQFLGVLYHHSMAISMLSSW